MNTQTLTFILNIITCVLLTAVVILNIVKK